MYKLLLSQVLVKYLKESEIIYIRQIYMTQIEIKVLSAYHLVNYHDTQ